MAGGVLRFNGRHVLGRRGRRWGDGPSGGGVRITDMEAAWQGWEKATLLFSSTPYWIIMQRDCIINKKRRDNMPIIPSGETWAKERDLMYDWKRNDRNERRTMTYHHDRRLLFRSRDWEAGMGAANKVAVGRHLPGR